MLKRLALFLSLMLVSFPAFATAPHGALAQSFTVTDIQGNTIYVGNIVSGQPFVQFNSTTSGIMLPVMTNTQMLAISGPQIGEMLFNSTNGAFEFYTGSQWSNVATPTTTGSYLLAGNGSGGIGNVTIGSGLNYNSSSQTLSLLSSVWVPNNIQVFTTSGTWTKPAGVSSVYVKVWGDGGGGTADGGNYGGGAGGYSEGYTAVTGNVTVSVGTGGAGGGIYNGTAGQGSSFAGTVTIAGAGGGGAASPLPGWGGAGSGGQINFTGMTGNTIGLWYIPYGGGGVAGNHAGQPGLVIVYY